jgi:predicted ATPase
LSKKIIQIRNLSQGERKLLGILFILNADDGSLFTRSGKYDLHRYFNEPEISLHPAWQSKLAGILIEQAGSSISGVELFDDNGDVIVNRSIVIETHSEYIVRGLQYEAMKAGRTEDVQIIYFDGKGGIIPIEINKDGTLTRPFGPGFYDESERLSLLLLDGLASKS